jgi:SRSO17 transposase
MNTATKNTGLPALTADLLEHGGCLADNLFADLWKQVGMKTLLNKSGFKKRSGTPISNLIYILVLWVWLKKDSIAMFAQESLQHFTTTEKDALYSTLNREDLNWRQLNLKVAIKAVQKMPSCTTPKAFVLDDSIKIRHGKKMPGVSSHFDHTLGRSVMGQQVLNLGLSCEHGYVPLDSEIFISNVKAQGLHQEFKDARSIVGKRYFQAQHQSKPQMAKAMMSRAIRAGVIVDYLLADAWFGTKGMLRTAEELSIASIVRMKKSKLKYRLTLYKDNKNVVQMLDLHELFQYSIRKNWQKIPGQPYQCKVLDVELNLTNSTSKEPEQWRNVRLLFVRGHAEPDKQKAGKNDWAVFLSTDINLEASKILEIYALRWAVEVYFKEAKQNLGFLKEQSNHYAAYIASIHLAAIRFCLLIIAKQGSGTGLPEVRRLLSNNLTDINFAARLWQVFKAVISGALNELEELLGDTINLVMDMIKKHINCFFVQALQLDTKTLRLEAL